MKGTLANKGRCPKCTLKPPCKHYDTMEQLIQSTGQPDMSVHSVAQATPDRGMFYPTESVVSGSGVSITTQSDAKHQRSDGFSVSSHMNLGSQSHHNAASG